MSKLDNIILGCVNKALDGKQEKLGDYVGPTKQQIKDFFITLMFDTWSELGTKGNTTAISFSQMLREKIEKL